MKYTVIVKVGVFESAIKETYERVLAIRGNKKMTDVLDDHSGSFSDSFKSSVSGSGYGVKVAASLEMTTAASWHDITKRMQSSESNSTDEKETKVTLQDGTTQIYSQTLVTTTTSAGEVFSREEKLQMGIGSTAHPLLQRPVEEEALVKKAWERLQLPPPPAGSFGSYKVTFEMVQGQPAFLPFSPPQEFKIQNVHSNYWYHCDNDGKGKVRLNNRINPGCQVFYAEKVGETKSNMFVFRSKLTKYRMHADSAGRAGIQMYPDFNAKCQVWELMPSNDATFRLRSTNSGQFQHADDSGKGDLRCYDQDNFTCQTVRFVDP